MASNPNGTNAKKRPANKCREWERERRNRFNEAISQLGKLIRESMKKVCDEGTDIDQTIQFPKIEIIQKAIIFIKEFLVEKSQLKSEILALQVKLEAEVKQKENKKDASTQIYKAVNTKLKSTRYNQLLMIKKCKHNALKQDVKNSSKSDPVKLTTIENTISTRNPPNLPIILPKSIINSKRPPENTIVVLPTPYVLPPRPLLFPGPSPAFVLLDPTLQPNCKASFPVVTRTGTDVTKTTMVNIVPISAYSHPLSLIKNRINGKTKGESTKKTIRQPKNSKKCSMKKNVVNKDVNEDNTAEDNGRVSELKPSDNDKIQNDVQETIIPLCVKDTVAVEKIQHNTPEKNDTIESITSHTKDKNNQLPSECKTKPIVKDIPIDLQEKHTIVTSDQITQPSKVNENMSLIIKTTEAKESEKVTSDNKEKQDKLTTILETNLCENTVDGGNARLELAEEFLAASPTAAFLMSFPLVSGNRADSPADDGHNTTQTAQTRDTAQRRNVCVETPQPDNYYTKVSQSDVKTKNSTKSITVPHSNKDCNQQKFINNNLGNKQSASKNIPAPTTSIENPFVGISAATMVSTNGTMTDTAFSMDFDCNIIKPSIPNHTASYVGNNNFFYNKNEPFSSVKSTMYSGSNITSGHDFNSLSLYPCAMEKYTTKNKTDYANVEENFMKIGSSRLTYDIDLGWPHKSFEFVNCTTSSNTFNKDNIFTTVSAPFTTFNPEFHVSLGTTSNKKDISTKTSSTYADTITNLYSQPSNFWPDEMPFYGNNNISGSSGSTKTLTNKQQSYLPIDHTQLNTNVKQNNIKQYDSKINDEMKSSNHVSSGVQQVSDKFSKKSPSKMHINWMTSETRPIQSNTFTTSHTELKESSKSSYGQITQQVQKKQEHNESNYFPIQMNNLPTQIPQEEFHVWPTSRPLGTTEISIDPPPINLPTLVGDLALGPHEKKKSEHMNRGSIQNAELTNCSNFLSVTQLMNRSSEHMTSRYQGNNSELSSKIGQSKQNIAQYTNESTRKAYVSRLDPNFVQPCYVFDDKLSSFDTMSQFANTTKPKTNKSSSDKFTKSHKNNYSAEALIRGGTQKVDHNTPPKFVMPTQKYNNFNSTHDGSVAQVSHFPPILDYTDNSYATQQLGTSHLYNSTTSTISNSFYSNFMPSSSNLMPSNYTGGNFSGDFIDYNQTAECNYTNQKYEEFKMRNNAPVFTHDKMPSTSYRNARRESATKHKLECSKKDTSKKCPNKKPKANTEVEDWSDTSNLLWQNRTSSKKHGNLATDELTFPNYPGNQVPAQYPTEFFNSHLMPTNVQSVGHNVDKSVPTFPGTSRANFNLSTIFPEITMKVQ